MPSNPICSPGLCDTIRFIVLTEETGQRSVVANVQAVPVGFQIHDVPGLDLSFFVRICDPFRCFFNDIPGSLIGRLGWARYIQPLTETICGTNPYDDGPGHWEVFALCGNVFSCD